MTPKPCKRKIWFYMSQIFRKIDNRFLDRGGLCSCSHGASSVSPLLLWGLLLYFTENLTSNFNQCGGSFPFYLPCWSSSYFVGTIACSFDATPDSLQSRLISNAVVYSRKCPRVALFLCHRVKRFNFTLLLMYD